MPSGHVLELSSLAERHPPIGQALLHAYAPAAIVRLSVDPTALSSDTMTRRVDVNWISRPGMDPAVSEHRDIGWNGLQDLRRGVCEQLPITVNEETLTEQAAIAVMALLVSDLESGVLQSVLQIGSGGDYLVIPGKGKPIQVEASGVREDATGSRSRRRLSEKSDQVLTLSEEGYASVTTFSHPPGAIVHSYLHYVRQGGAGKTGKTRRRRK